MKVDYCPSCFAETSDYDHQLCRCGQLYIVCSSCHKTISQCSACRFPTYDFLGPPPKPVRRPKTYRKRSGGTTPARGPASKRRYTTDELEDEFAPLERRAPKVEHHHAARHNLNVVQRRPQGYYAFLEEVEGDSTHGFHIKLQLVGRSWFDQIWIEMGKRFGYEFRVFAGAFVGREFESAYPKLNPEQRWATYLFHRWFVDALRNHASGPAPVANFEFYISPADPLLARVSQKQWYRLELSDTNRSPRLQDNLFSVGGVFSRGGLLWELGDTPSADKPEQPRWIVDAQELANADARAPFMSGMLALHWPQAAPPLPPPRHPDRPDPRPVSESPVPWISLRNFRSVHDHALRLRQQFNTRISEPTTRWLRRAAQHLETWWFGGGPPLALAGLGVANMADLAQEAVTAASRKQAVRCPRHDAEHRCAPSRTTPLAEHVNPNTVYCGSPGGANPMDAGAGTRDPAVAFLDVGQGNCNALYDNEGRAIVYYDFGSPTASCHGSTPNNGLHTAAPCLCNGPLIVLSHWDQDHCSLGRFYPEAYRCRWIAPQQHMGTGVCKEVVAGVIHAGGEMLIWSASGTPGDAGTPNSATYAAGSHMRFPWGFIERCDDPTVANPWANDANARNVTGLAMGVCVHDNGVGAGGAASLGNALDVAGGNPGLGAAVAAAGPGAPTLPNLAGLVAAVGALGAVPPEPARVAAVLAPAIGLAGDARTIAAAVAGSPAGAGLVPAVVAALATAAAAAAAAARGAGATDNVVAAAVGAAVACVGGPANAVNSTAIGAAAGGGPALAAGALANALVATLAALGGVAAGGGVAAISACNHVNANVAALAAGPETVAAATSVGAVPTPGLTMPAAAARAAGANTATVCAKLGAVGTTIQGGAPIHANERYVLLTGDANFGFIPTLRHPITVPLPAVVGGVPHPIQPPAIVGLSATHHGSNIVGTGTLALDAIPWAPNSPAAIGAVAAAEAVITNDEQRVIAAALANAPACAGQTPAQLAARAVAAEQAANACFAAAGNKDNAADAAAAAVALPGGPALAPLAAAIGTAAGGGAALPAGVPANALAATAGVTNAGGGFANGGLAALFALGGPAANVIGVAGAAAAIEAAVRVAAITAAAPAAAVTTAAVNVVHACHQQHATYPAAAPVAPCLLAAAVGAGVPAAVTDNAQAAAVATAAAATIAAGAIAAAVTVPLGVGVAPGQGAAAIAALGAAFGAMGGGPPYDLRAVAAAVGTDAEALLWGLMIGPWAYKVHTPATLAGHQCNAAVIGVAHGQGTRLDAWRVNEAHGAAVLGNQATGVPSVRCAALLPNVTAACAIAFSYGVKTHGGNPVVALAAPYQHCYRENGGGGLGHPHYIALDKYEAHGWVHRTNTSTFAHQGQQPDAGSPRGDSALGWRVNAGVGGPLVAGGGGPAGTIQRTCTACGGARNFVV